MSSNKYFAYRSFWPEFETIKNFASAGINTICFFPANSLNSLGEPYCKYPPNWLWFDKYDFSSVDKQISDLLEANPKAEFLCMVDLNSPQWLARQLSLAHNDGGDTFTNLSQTLCNTRWREATLTYMRNFLKHCKEKHSGKIKAYILACGHTDEWFDYAGNATGPSKNAAYHVWREQQQLPMEDIPSMECVNNILFDNLLHDPKSESSTFDYLHFNNSIISKAICDFATEARKTIRKDAEIGVFYGYIMDRIGFVASGHADYEKVLTSKDIDFLISPGTYQDREIGGGSGFLTASGSERLAGKRHMHECDQRTHTYNRDLTPFVKLEVPYWPDTKSDIAGMKREFALSVIKGNSLWWFDMWGGFYQEPELLKNLAVMKKLWNHLGRQDYDAVEEVALIVDPDSMYYFDQDSPRQADFTLNTRKQLNRLGAPYESYSLNDIPNIPDLERYKFLIFSTPIEITQEKADMLRRYVLNNDRMVLWLYAPGISNGVNLDTTRVKQWAGVEYGYPELSISNMGAWKSAYLHAPEKLTPCILKELATKAGVHIYCKEEQAVYVNSKLIAIHTACGGERQINLPVKYKRIRELFSEHIAAENTDTFYWDFATPDTVLFKLEKY